ncbi:ATP-binding cassette domain-containing protein [Rudaeicoccus suwonensis]|uniref:ABC-type multidrug transport system fused ATPase/permease subunit n=1 Tax=Rudaeicoccus suwonensis TaxID=657409 RepID=A0A561E487_9MICO|nr:ABC transporter ATP-binding protein [Rudaeicoccus suwonensis]TWE10422.1 ABC-type multidrug transport system fused ATPase/permease subunit [Rudaeicoccus suwonensis]
MIWFDRELHFARMTWHASPPLTAVCAALVAVRGFSVWLAVYASGHLVQSIAQRDHDAWHWLVLVAVGVCTEPLASAWQDSAVAGLQARFTRQQVLLLSEAALAPHGIEHLENPESRARFNEIEQYLRNYFGLNAMQGCWAVAGFSAIGIGGMVAVGHWSWWGAVVAFTGYRVMRISWRAYLDVVLRDLVENGSVDRRRADYLRALPLERGAGKELRLFGITPWVVTGFAEVFRQAMVDVWDRRWTALRPALGWSLVGTAALLATFAWVGHSAWSGDTSVATLVIAMQGIVQMAGLGPIGDYSVQAMRARFYENEIRELRSAYGFGPTLAEPHAAGPGTRPMAPAMQALPVDVTDVTFTYPARDEPVFKGLDLHIPAGQSVAVVGVNGVGKSTLIKLLCGLYAADVGSIRIGGGDPAVDDAVRRKVATIFQDFVRYHLSLRENVALPLLTSGQPDEGDDIARQALHDAAGDDVLARVDGDWDTVLEPGYAGGTDLSGGQWQRVAIARALAAVATGAGILVLDEPTAALDVRAEAEILSRFLEVTRGVTTILVSHRLSSVRHADRIVVLGPNGVVQDGSHDQLLTEGGVYADMFRLQASRFEKAAVGIVAEEDQQ